MNTTLILSSLSLLAGGLLLSYHALAPRRPALSIRLSGRAQGFGGHLPLGPLSWPERLSGVRASYERELRQAGGHKSMSRLFTEKALLAFAAPFVPLAPYAAATGRLPSTGIVLLFGLGGFFVPDLVLRQEARRRKETIFLDLPDAISVLALALGAGQSLRQALELAARDCEGPVGEEIERALTLARRDRALNEREALIYVSREAGEPTFARFAELLAAKESPYLEFLRGQAAQARADQARYLERAADRAYLAMHAPIAPLLAVLVLLVAYGLLRFLAQTV